MSWLFPEEDEQLPFRYADNPIGTESNAQLSAQPGRQLPPPPAPRGWGDAWQQFKGDVGTGASAVGGLLTADIQTPIAQGMAFPNLVIPEGATIENWDDGPKFRLPDGSLKDPKDLPQRGTVLPYEKDPKGWGDTSLAMPGFVNALPALGSTFISLFKDTSLAAAIAVPELTFYARKINNESFRVIETWTITSLIYVAACVLLAALLRLVERRLAIPR